MYNTVTIIQKVVHEIGQRSLKLFVMK